MLFGQSSCIGLCTGVCFLSSVISTFASDVTHPALVFEENRGQAPQDVRYLARTHTGSLLLTSQKAIFHSSLKAGGVPGR
jgi:hypothetical protein